MVLRIGAFILLVCSTVAFPWWLGFFLVLIFIFCFRNFYEAGIVALIFDILRSLPGISMRPEFFYTTIILVAVFLAEQLKQRIVFYK